MENDAHTSKYEDTDPHVQIRTDLWNTMGTPELSHQRDLLMSRMEQASRMFDHNTSPSLITMYTAMQQALKDINNLIDTKSTQK